MSTVQQSLCQLHTAFTLSADQLNSIAGAFLRDMTEGLKSRPSSLAMLPSFLTKPTGQEQGVFLALDFGGTNVRVLLVELKGQGKHTILARRDVPLSDLSNGYDYTSSTATAAELFGFLASQLALLATPGKTYLLGHTFSFPCRQTGTNQAVLLHWTKEIKTTGVVGQNIVELLQQALTERSLSYIHPTALVNDTVSALLAVAYQDSQADIGSICGTGHNTCYLEPAPASLPKPMYLNIEAGNFDKAPGNKYDVLLDNNSACPGAGRLEKMCAGRYIGELLRLAIVDLIDQRALFNGSTPAFLLTVNALTGKDVAALLTASSATLEHIPTWLAQKGSTIETTYEERQILQTAASLIASRSARLAAATYTAIIRHIDPAMNKRHTIAIDGSLYEKLPGYAQTIAATLQELLGEQARQINCVLTKDGSGAGAAIAAATTLHAPSR
jgi:hexokinase